MPCADPEGGGRGSGPPPLKNHKNIGFLCSTGPDPLKNHKATKPALNVGPSSTRQRNAIEKAFRWRVDDSPFIAVYGSSFPLSSYEKKTKKKNNTILRLNLKRWTLGYLYQAHCRLWSYCANAQTDLSLRLAH